jgi:ABC-2 type transport system permease protein
VKSSRVLTVTKKTLRSLRHDRRTVAFVVFVPLLMIALFGYTFGGDLKDIKVAIVDLDQGNANTSIGTQLAAQLSSDPVLKVVDSFGPGNVSLLGPTVDRVESGELWAVIVLPRNLTIDVSQAVAALTHGGAVVPVGFQVYVDSTNPNIATAVYAEAQKALQEVLVSQFHVVPPLFVLQTQVHGQGAQFIDFFAPGVMSLAVLMVTFMLSIVSFVHERSAFTLERVLTTPITEGEFVAGYALAFGVVALMQSTVILAAAILLFNIQVIGSVLLVLLVIFLLGVGMQGLGFVLSATARSEFQAIQFLPLILFPSILLAGVFWPLEAVPDVLRPVSNFIPLTYAVDASRSIMIRGWGADQVWPQMLVLAGFAVAMLLLSVWSLKRRG